MNTMLKVQINDWRFPRQFEIRKDEFLLEVILRGCECDRCERRLNLLCQNLDSAKVGYEIEKRREKIERQKNGRVSDPEHGTGEGTWLVLPLPTDAKEDLSQIFDSVKRMLGVEKFELVPLEEPKTQEESQDAPTLGILNISPGAGKSMIIVKKSNPDVDMEEFMFEAARITSALFNAGYGVIVRTAS